jgi:tryptophan-rich sensory protein
MTQLASRSQLRMSFLRYAVVTVPLVLFLGLLSGRLAGSGYGNPWFDALDKPAMMPPGWVFGAVWTLLYVLLGLALALVLHARGAAGRPRALAVFLIGLAVNYVWSPLFFAYHEVDAAFWLILAMILLTVAAILLFWKIRPFAAWLLLPYLAWLAFAALLTWQIGALNPGAAELVPGVVSSDIAS